MTKKTNQFLKSITILIKIKKYSNFFVAHTMHKLVSCQHIFLKLSKHVILTCFTIMPRRRPGLIMKVYVHLLNSVTITPIVLRSILVVSHQNMFLEALATIMTLNPMWFSVYPHSCNVQRRLPFIVFVSMRAILPYI